VTDLLTKLDDWEDLELDEKIALVRGAYTPRDVCEQFELTIVGDKIRSPFNEADETPSCHLYEDGWFDYSTGKWGDVIDLVVHLSGRKPGQVLRQLAAGIQSMELDPDRVKRAEKKIADLTALFYDLEAPMLDSGGCAGRWAMKLPGVSVTHLRLLFMEDRLAVDRQDSLLIPHWHNGIVTGIKIRHTDGRKTSVSGSSFAAGLYETLAYRWDQVAVPAVIVEGESDCWALERQLMNVAHVYALPSGAGLWRDDWLAQLVPYDTIYTAFDNDQAGQKATEKVRSAIGWGRWKELRVPQLYNDVREALCAGWEPKL
jgi:hypothetical protein